MECNWVVLRTEFEVELGYGISYDNSASTNYEARVHTLCRQKTALTDYPKDYSLRKSGIRGIIHPFSVSLDIICTTTTLFPTVENDKTWLHKIT